MAAAVENKELLAKIAELGERAAMGTGIEIADVQLRGGGKARLLRIYIDKPGGVTHGDCETISHELSKLLDEGDVVPGDSYTLEVSSPGIDRPLFKPRDFERAVGQNLRLAVQPPGQKSRQSLEGRLTKFANGELEIEVGPGHLVHVPFDSVQKAKLKFEW